MRDTFCMCAPLVLCRELVMTVNIPVQEMNATCRIVSSMEFDALILVPLKTVQVAYQDGGIATVATMQ